MEKESVIGISVILGVILISLVSAGFILHKTELNTYSVSLRVEGTSGYPQKLTQIALLDVKQETKLASIIPTFRVGGLSVTSPYSSANGILEIDCGGGYKKIENFYISTNNIGDKMTQNFIFTEIEPDRFCYVTARVSECQTQNINSLCLKNQVSTIIRIP